MKTSYIKPRDYNLELMDSWIPESEVNLLKSIFRVLESLPSMILIACDIKVT